MIVLLLINGINDRSYFLKMISSAAQIIKTTSARIKSSPPSFCTTMPSFIKCDNKAPLITLDAISAPILVNLGISSSAEAISSIQPVAILPHGSTPS